MKQLTKKAWFGPKQYAGWGLAPRSWGGWIATALFTALMVLNAYAWQGARIDKEIIGGVLIVLFILLIIFSGGKLGGPSSAENHS